MNDQDLIKHVAEILDLAYIDLYCGRFFISSYVTINPLANTNEAKAFCWDLMLKNDFRVFDLWNENDGTPHYEVYNDKISVVDKNPQRAVLLAFVELNKDK